MFDRWASLFFPTKILSEDPYLKSFISRVRTKYRERFSSFSRYRMRRVVTTYFLSSLQCDDGTIAVKYIKIFMNIIYQEKLFVSIFCSKCVVIDYGIIFNCFYKTQ